MNIPNLRQPHTAEAWDGQRQVYRQTFPKLTQRQAAALAARLGLPVDVSVPLDGRDYLLYMADADGRIHRV